MFVFKMTAQEGGRGSNLESIPGRACDHCRRRKMKCDRQRPCGVCLATKATCSYEAVPRRKGRPPLESRRQAKQRQQRVGSWSPQNGLHAPSGSTDGFVDLNMNLNVDATSPSLSPSSKSPGSGDWTWQVDDGSDDASNPSPSSLTLDTAPVPEITTAHTQGLDSLFSLSQLAPGSVPAPAPALNSPEQGVTVRYPFLAFSHWTRVFLTRLYPVFPVVEPGYLLSKLGVPRDAAPRSLSRFFAAMSAAVIVQLNLSTAGGNQQEPTGPGAQPSRPWPQAPDERSSSQQLADNYIRQCMSERQDPSFIEDADEWAILESFFIFSYYGNRNKSKQAWYYLREAIGFALALRLDREESYNDPDLEVNERRRRLYWLLFITERAYCLQHRTTCSLRNSIALPKIYDGCDEPTLTGFVTLAMLFTKIDADFVSSWSERSPRGAYNAIANVFEPDQISDISHMSVIDEIQRVDVAVTQCWLHTLVRQLHSQSQSQSGSQSQCTKHHEASEATSLSTAARGLLLCFKNTRLESLESHGIGMEQKVSDIAGYLCDLLPSLEPDHLAGDVNSIPNLLHEFMCLLSNFRNEESCYLGPLAARATALLMQRAGVEMLGSCENVVRDYEDGHDGEIIAGWQ